MSLVKWGLAAACLLAGTVALSLYVQGTPFARADSAPLPEAQQDNKQVAMSASDKRMLDRSGDHVPRVVGFGHVDVEGGTIPLTVPNVGQVAEVLVQEGDRVEAGAPLIRLDDAQALARLDQAQSQVEQAELKLKEAQRAPETFELKKKMQDQAIAAAQTRLAVARQEVERLEKLAKDNVVPTEEFQTAKQRLPELEAALEVERLRMQELQLQRPADALRLAQVAVQAAKAQKALAEQFLNSHTLRAPTAGLVLRLMVAKGQMLSQNATMPALWFCPDNLRIVRCEIDEEFASRVEVGMPAKIYSDDADAPVWAGKVRRCAEWIAHRRSLLDEPFQRNDVRTLECIIEFDDTAAAPRIGRRMRVVLFDRPSAETSGTASPAENQPLVKEPLANAQK